ncbi:hypothetical protein [Jiangella asiatica]|uniref:hypothetical protein n=1 Tax=Jiangella asiatica TaxID=2530372 RepID=UPI0013A5BE73|nr:hypothetical protein [Jiangella asiatica]
MIVPLAEVVKRFVRMRGITGLSCWFTGPKRRSGGSGAAARLVDVPVAATTELMDPAVAAALVSPDSEVA